MILKHDGAGAQPGTGSIRSPERLLLWGCSDQATSGGSISFAPGMALSSALV